MLTAEQLHSILAYDPTTGIFTWKVMPNGRVKAGGRAGAVHPRNGYRRIMIQRRMFAEHRLAWFYQRGEWPPDEVDHIDGDRANNAFANLRLAVKSDNQANRGANKNNRHGSKGVVRHQKGRKLTGKWVARITKDRKRYHLGVFKTPEEAHAAYAAAAQRLFGSFARSK